MLFAPTLADRAILPTAWRGRYFFNRIGQKQTLVNAEILMVSFNAIGESGECD